MVKRIEIVERFPEQSPFTPVMAGVGYMTSGLGEVFITKVLKKLNKKWQGLSVFPTADTLGMKDLIFRLQGVSTYAHKYLGQPKKDLFLAALNKAVAKQKTYIPGGRVAASRNRFVKQMVKLRGVLDYPVQETEPAAQKPPTDAKLPAPVAVPGVPAGPGVPGAPVPYKNLIIGAAITTIVGFVVISAIKKKK